MIQSNTSELNRIKKKILVTLIIGSFGFIFLGIGLYGLFGVDGNALHPLLENKNFIYGLLAAGAIIEVWQLFVLIPLFIKQSKLLSESNDDLSHSK